MEDTNLCQVSVPLNGARSDKKNKHAIIGLYGLPGCGKSFLLAQLKKQLSHREFMFYEGSEVIGGVVPGGLEAFKELQKDQQYCYRETAIEKIAEKCRHSNKSAVVTGHLMFWSHRGPTRIDTAKDMDYYTHIIYLDVPATTIAEQSLNDKQRSRPRLPVKDLESWQRTELTELAVLCRQHGILFSRLSGRENALLMTAFKQIQFSYRATIDRNSGKVGEAISACIAKRNLKTAVVVDADKTLSTDDASVKFWEVLGADCPLKDLFSSPLRYSETALLQATLLYEEATNEDKFERICTIAASRIKMHPDFISLFRFIEAHSDILVVVVTCGIRRVWEKILEDEGFAQTIQVIGGSRISDGIVVTPDVKAQVVKRLQQEQIHVVALGDSPLDLPMLEAADEAIVVTGEERNRSRSMDVVLSEAISTSGLRARQCLLPDTVSPRLNLDMLPQMLLTDVGFLESLHTRGNGRPRHAILHSTDRYVSKVLMSPMRNALNAGPALRKTHENVALYLAWEFLTDLLGVEEYPMQHVQGHQVSGYRFLHEKRTTIVALMRGGEPMALGLSEALPLAMFVHARQPDAIKNEHLDGQQTIILVDSVINSGKTLIPFMEYVRGMQKGIKIVVVAGVVQSDAVRKEHAFAKAVEQHGVHVVSLRLSENRFNGTKGTDTGHRLFNTVHMN